MSQNLILIFNVHFQYHPNISEEPFIYIVNMHNLLHSFKWLAGYLYEIY
jgi:hypothetical protein